MKKNKKRKKLWGAEPPPLLTMAGLVAPRSTKKRGDQAPLPPSPFTMGGNKASPPNYTDKYQKVKKEESNLLLLFKKCMKAWFDICTQVELFTRQLGVNSLHIGQPRLQYTLPTCKLHLILMTLNMSQAIIKAMLAVGCTSVNLP